MKIAIIGAGNVGATIAYTLATGGIASDVSLIDVNTDKAYGEILDIAHGGAVSEQVNLRAEGYEGLENADIIVHAAGRGRKPGESRLDLAKGNIKITEAIIGQMKKHYNGRSLLLVVSNPMDILTYVCYKRMGIDKSRIFGSGTVLDSSRFKYLLCKHFKVSPRNMHAMVIGEHGDSAVPFWSAASIGPVLLSDYPSREHPRLTEEDRVRISADVVHAGQEVIRLKGATFYAIAMVVTRIIKAILSDENRVLCVSSFIENLHGVNDVCLSMPAIVGKDGIREVLDLPLSADEKAGLQKSAAVIKALLKEVEYQ
ncbi:MAG: L-lactate dehydrogenase [Holophaga sp.]|nr:L-lactate dehydrogenase [Holophaga sp.]